MDTIFDISRTINNLYNMYYQVMVMISLITLLFSGLQCFFGFKFFKIFSGFVGFVLFFLIGLLSKSVFVAILFAIVGAFLAYHLYQVGVFILSSTAGLILGIILGAGHPIIGIIIALISGVVSLFLIRPMIILSTSFTGGFSMGTSLAILFKSSLDVGCFFGFVFFVIGAYYQFNSTKSSKSEIQESVDFKHETDKTLLDTTSKMNYMDFFEKAKEMLKKFQTSEVKPIKKQINSDTNDKNKLFTLIKDLVEKIEKIVKLYNDGIYSEEEYQSRKKIWIDNLENLNLIQMNYEDFLCEITSLIKKNIFSPDEVERIKSIVVGNEITSDFENTSREMSLIDQLIDQLKKMNHIFNEGIYSNEEYVKQKDLWIENLKKYPQIRKNGENFLIEISPFITNEKFNEVQLKNIKYVVIGTYFKDKEKEEKEKFEKIKQEKIKKINKQIDHIKSKSCVVFNKQKEKSKDLIQKLKTSKKAKYNILAAILAVLVICSIFYIGKTMTKPIRVVDQFEQAINSNDKKILLKSLNVEGVQLDDKNIEPFVKFLNGNQSIIEELRQEANELELNSELKLLDDNDEIYIEKIGNKFLFFPKYKVSLNPVYLLVKVNAKDAIINLNGKKIATSDSSNYEKLFGPFVPGIYNIESVYKGKYTNINDSIQINTFKDYDKKIDSHKFEIDLLSRLKVVNIDSEYEDAEIYVDGQATGVKVKEARKFGPLNLGAKIYAKKELRGKVIKSDDHTIDEYDASVYLSFEDSLLKIRELAQTMQELMDGYTRELCYAVNNDYFKDLEKYLYPGSSIYKMQKKYVSTAYEKSISEHIKSFQILSYNIGEDNKTGIVKTEEVYEISNDNDEESKIKTFKYTYNIKYNELEQKYQLESITKTK